MEVERAYWLCVEREREGERGREALWRGLGREKILYSVSNAKLGKLGQELLNKT